MLFSKKNPVDNDDTEYIKELNERVEKLERFFSSIELLSNQNSKTLSPLFYDLIGVDELNNQKFLIVCIHETIGELSLQKPLKIIAVGDSFSGITNCPYLDFEITRLALDKKFSLCKILWIESQDNHKGYGSLLLEHLFLYIKNRYKSITEVYGDLAAEERPTKQAHSKRLESFYRKNGFDVLWKTAIKHSEI